MSDIKYIKQLEAQNMWLYEQARDKEKEIERLRTRMREIVVLPDHYHISVANEIARAALEGK